VTPGEDEDKIGGDWHRSVERLAEAAERLAETVDLLRLGFYTIEWRGMEWDMIYLTIIFLRVF
jgi:hypothetical protein